MPKLARGSAAIRFTLSRPASVELRIETPETAWSCATCRLSACRPGRSPSSGTARLPHGTRAYGGRYVAHVFVTSAVGTSDLSAPFSFRRTGLESAP